MKTRHWQPAKGENQSRNAFYRFLRSKGMAASPNLWDIFKNWRNNRERQDFVTFHQAYQNAIDSAQAQLANWQHPLKNAKKGEPYDLILNVPVSHYKLTGLEKAGLKCEIHPHNPRLCRISGIPLTAGDFPITLIYKAEGFSCSGLPAMTRTFRLIVNPDPKDLWNDIPSDQHMEYARPDQEDQSLYCGSDSMYAASLRGRSHAHTGLPRDDAFALACEDGWRLMAVSDGAGSAAFSRKGAELACFTALNAIPQKLREEGNQLEQVLNSHRPGEEENIWQPQARKLAYGIMGHAAFEAHKAIRQEATAKKRDIKNYACTLLLIVLKQLPQGWLVLSFQVGDGAMAMFTNTDAVLLAQPDEGEYSGQTRFLTMNDIFDGHELMRRLRVSYTAGLKGLLLMTDGVSDPRFGTQEGLANKQLWLNLWDELNRIIPDARASLLDWLNFWEKGHHDDRTIAILRTGEPCPK